MNIMADAWNPIESCIGGDSCHVLIEGKEFPVLGADEEVDRDGDEFELFPEGRLRSGAHALQSFGEFCGVVGVTAIEEFGEAWMISQGFKKFGVVPRLEKGWKITLQFGGEFGVLGAAIGSIGLGAKSRGCGFEEEMAESIGVG